MILEIWSKLNFLDYIILIVLFRICYIAAKTGMSIEIFKLSGTLLSTYIALHYYTGIADIIQRRFSYQAMSLEFLDFVVFVLLLSSVYLLFIGLRSLLFRFVQFNAIPKINQFAGLILGVLRSFLVVGLLSFMLAISSVNYLQAAVKQSYLGSRFFMVSPQTYSWFWDNIFSKFQSREKYNPTVTETVNNFQRR